MEDTGAATATAASAGPLPRPKVAQCPISTAEEAAAKEEMADAEGGRRSKRSHKAVEVIYKVEAPKAQAKLVVEGGRGATLGEVPSVEAFLRKAPVEERKYMHALLFGRKGAAKNVRGNIRKFSGLIYSNETHKKEVLDKKKQWMTGQTLKVLKSIGVAFGVQTSGTKGELISRVADFLDEPRSLKNVKTPTKTTPRKSSASKTPTKVLVAWDWYARERRPAQAAIQTDKSTSEITAILKAMWNAETEESKKRYKAMAKEYAKRPAKKSPASKKKVATKKTTKNSTKKAKVKSKEFVDEEDLESDADEESADEGGDDEKSPEAKRKRNNEDDDKKEKKKAKVDEEDNSSDSDEEEDSGEATGLAAEQLAEIKKEIRAFLSTHEDYKKVRANQVRQHLQETIPTLAMSPVLKVFIKNTAISVISQMGSPEPARVD